MKRRTLLSLSGTVLAALAGCTGGLGTRATPTPSPAATPTPIPGPKRGEDLPSDPDPDDGYPPEFETTPAPPDVEVDSFETLSQGGVEVPLAPVEVTYRWYARGEARFADARGAGQYDRAHVYGAVLSTAPDGPRNAPDPVEDWPTDDRIVCYCGCPHHLSSIRAANLISSGYEEVYVIDEGVGAWYDLGYPMAGSAVAARPDPWVIEGVVEARHAGETAWARHPPSDQREAAPIAEDGSYELELHFSDVTADSEVIVETPAYRVADSLGDLSSGVLSGDR